MQDAKGLVLAVNPRVVIAGGSGALGQKIALNFVNLGHEVFILTRRVRDSVAYKQLVWDGTSVEPSWASIIPGSILINLSGELVDRRPTPENIALLKSSRVSPTETLVRASEEYGAPSIWLQMSTLAIYGDAGELVLDEASDPAEGPEQMAGVAKVWEAALQPISGCRIVFLRTGIVLDSGTPALNRLIAITRMFMGGTVGDGDQWVSWIHIRDFIGAINFIVGNSNLSGVIHITSPNPVRNKQLMASLRAVLHKPWSPPTPALVIRLGSRFIFKTDPMLALSGRHAVPAKLLAAGFEFEKSDLGEALEDLCR